MKIIYCEEAMKLIMANPEQTIQIRIEGKKNLSLLGFMEKREISKEYPEGIATCLYADGSGWLINKDIFLKYVGDTILEKAVFEHGYHSGDIYYYSDDAMEVYLNGDDMVFMVGTDAEFQQILPYLAEGEYCFIFEDEHTVKYRHFVEIHNEFRLEDAESQIETYCDIYDVDDETKEKFIANVDKVIDYFERHEDCNIDDNSLWDAAVRYVHRQIKEDN